MLSVGQEENISYRLHCKINLTQAHVQAYNEK